MLICLSISFSISAYATSRAVPISPSLSFSGTTANCSVRIIEAGKQIDVNLELWNGNTLIDSWPGSGSSYVIISGSCGVDSGKTYSLKVSGTIGNSIVNETLVTKTCP